MDVDSTENRLEELSGLPKEEGALFNANLSDQGHYSDLRYNEVFGSSLENFESDLQTEFNDDLQLNGPAVTDTKEEGFAGDLVKSSTHVESESFHHEMGIIIREEELEDTLTHHERIEDRNLLEESKSANGEQDHEVYDLQPERLQGNNEATRANILDPHEHNLEQNPQESTSPSDKENFSSQEKYSIDKEVLLEDQRQKAASPEESPHGSQHMNGGSLENRDSCEKHKRRYSSASRSPIRQRDSSSQNKRDHHHRSRSRSPYGRDYHRKSPRRSSPRRKSPPAGYHGHGRSPKRKQWSPPHNRNTGLGQPGRNLFIAGFSFLTTERDLERKFSGFGRVLDFRIVRDKRSGDLRGFGFLSLERDEEADAAIRALDKTEWYGRIVLVEKSKSH